MTNELILKELVKSSPIDKYKLRKKQHYITDDKN